MAIGSNYGCCRVESRLSGDADAPLSLVPLLSALIQDSCRRCWAHMLGSTSYWSSSACHLRRSLWCWYAVLPDWRERDDRFLVPRYLDRLALDVPAVAPSNASLETVRMAELLDRMFRKAVEALKSGKTKC